MDVVPNIRVQCMKCQMQFMTNGDTAVDRIVKCPAGHRTVVKAGTQGLKRYNPVYDKLDDDEDDPA